MSDDGPQLLRPIPRRPFDLEVSSPTPPDEDSRPQSPNPDDFRLANGRFLNPHYDGSSAPNGLASLADVASGRAVGGGGGDENSISRVQSVMNLTSSTLFGIYGAAAAGRAGASGYYNDRDEPETPWGTGAQTPVKPRPGAEQRLRRMTSHGDDDAPPHGPRPTKLVAAFSLAARATLLFALGMGYGVLVSRLRDEHTLAGLQTDTLVNPGYDFRHLVFWGVCGVGLGVLLPWFDGRWDDAFGSEGRGLRGEKNGESDPGTDWALVMRGIGAFAGIVFAIRKLPWASTMQASLTLALVNPFLWYLIDRSKPGFLLSAAVGLTGSAILMGIDSQIMPSPGRASWLVSASRNASNLAATAPQQDPTLLLGGLARQETVESGIWMLSVLFCSCVCFGNIGRRLALNTSAAGRGRWGGVR